MLLPQAIVLNRWAVSVFDWQYSYSLCNTMTELVLYIPTHNGLFFFFKRNYGSCSHDLLSLPISPNAMTNILKNRHRPHRMTSQTTCQEESRSIYISSPGRECMNYTLYNYTVIQRHCITPLLIYMHHSLTPEATG